MIQEFINLYGAEIIGALLSGVAGYVALQIKALYKRYADTQIKKDVISTCVKAVEQLYTDIHGDEKKFQAILYANKLLADKGINISEQELGLLIEAAVKEFNQNIK